MSTELDNWIGAYRAAWTSNAPDDIRRLFTDDAEYRTAPFRQPWRGHDEIVAEWTDRPDEPGTWSFEWSALVEQGDTRIITATTHYPDESYSNLWIIELGTDGRARSFTEWWMTIE
jgi:hypothetical protein